VSHAPRIRLMDSTLRDGSHALAHSFREEQVRAVVAALDSAGVPVIEVSHGDGLGGSSLTYGTSAVDERLLVRAAVDTAQHADIAVLLLPGIGTVDDLRAAADLGVRIARIATHCTEADISEQHFGEARALGLETVGFLMMAHSVGPDVLARQARIMADSGAQSVYVTDSAGALILDEVSERVASLVAEVGPGIEVGFHGHQNLGLGVANTIAAIRSGAVQVDGCTRGLGAGAGNTPTEVLVAVCDRLGIDTGVDVPAILDASEDVVRPLMESEPVMSRMTITMGYAGVYSSFLRHAYIAAQRYGVSGTEILRRCGERKLVGGQEDQIIDIAVALSRGG